QLRRGSQTTPDLPQRNRTRPVNLANIVRRLFSTISRRPFKDRVIHLLALKNYKKPELLDRLQREGVMQKDKDSLGKILDEVANMDATDNSFSLKDHFFKEIQKDWPGYSEIDREALEVILSGKSAPSQNATSTRQSPSAGPSHRDTPPRT
ncbi:ELL2 factor, partial [Climacteris rufus]|nr:ELL2 factor [Climacteris rufus]